jgi:hypothetical protein
MKRNIIATLFILLSTNVLFAQYSKKEIENSLKSLNENSEIEVVVKLIKGSIPDYYPSEIAASLILSLPAPSENKTIKVLPYVRDHIITKGKDLDRIAAIADKLLKFMWLKDRVSIVYFNSEVPVLGFNNPNAIIVSNAAESLLTDKEIEAIMAHEICHLIIYENFKQAVEKKNLQQLRTLELFCDAAAVSIIEAKGGDSSRLISGLEKMQSLIEKVTGDTDGGLTHPLLRQRKKLVETLKANFNSALSRAMK